jgi:DNA-binding NarL/FixJ family response regulator
VAELAASGMINKDVATELFNSPRTVEANLGRVHSELSINPGAELSSLIGDLQIPFYRPSAPIRE